MGSKEPDCDVRATQAQTTEHLYCPGVSTLRWGSERNDPPGVGAKVEAASRRFTRSRSGETPLLLQEQVLQHPDSKTRPVGNQRPQPGSP